MPNKRCLEPHELIALGDAFELACQELGIGDVEDSKRGRLAKSILMLIDRGESVGALGSASGPALPQHIARASLERQVGTSTAQRSDLVSEPLRSIVELRRITHTCYGFFQ